MAGSLQRYELYDVLSGEVYAAFVPSAEVAALDLCHKKRHRLLAQVKAAATAPVGRFAESMSNSTIVNGSLWEPPGGSHPSQQVPRESQLKKGPQAFSSPTQEVQSAPSISRRNRATGKTGACWCKQSTQQFLKLSMKHKEELRKRVTPLSVYQRISDDLFFQNDLDYSAEQLREKMRNLKRFFKEVKGGNHLGSNWEFFLLMEELFDLPITTDNCLEDSEIISGAPILMTGHPDETLIEDTDLNSNTLVAKTYIVKSPMFKHNTPELIEIDLDEPLPLMEEIDTRLLPQTDAGKTFVVKSPMFQHNTPELNEIDLDEPLPLVEEIDTELLPQTDAGKTYVVKSPMFQHKTTCVEPNDFDVSSPAMKDTVSVPYTGVGETFIVQSPMFVRKASAVDRMNLDTSFLSLEDDDEEGTDDPKGFDPTDPANFRSPAKKKLSSKGASATVRTPQKTPKRKVPQNSFTWPIDVLDMFLNECMKRKAEVSKNPVPLNTWKDISAVLQARGHQYSWELCRAKFESMLNFFWKSLIPAGGILCEVKSNYYDQFCIIFDVAKPASNVDSGKVWKDPKISKLLLTLYGDMKEEFDKSSNRHDALYAQIASEMYHFGIQVSGVQCRNRLNDMKQEFRAEYDRTRKTGSAPASWPFFDQMFDMFKGSVTLEAPVSLSVGTTVQHLQKGAATEPLETGSRTRPVVAQPRSARNRASGKKEKVTVQKQNVTVQQQQTEQTNAIANELRLTREAMDRRSDERWKDFLHVMLNQSVPRGVTNRDKNFTM